MRARAEAVKRLVACIVAASLVAAALSACGGDPPTSASPAVWDRDTWDAGRFGP